VANKALPLLVAGGAALILLGGKKKKKSLMSSCIRMREPAAVSAILRSKSRAKFPFAMVVYPDGQRAEGERICDDLVKAGAGAGALSGKNLLIAVANEAGIDPSQVPADTVEHGVAVLDTFDSEPRIILWESIPSNVADMLK